MRPALSLLLFASSPAFAATLLCRADYDDGSHYELAANVGERGVEGLVGLRYVTTDGIDLHSDLTPKSQSFAPGKRLLLRAESETMGANLDAANDAGADGYRGSLEMNFDLEHAEPFSVDAACTLR